MNDYCRPNGSGATTNLHPCPNSYQKGVMTDDGVEDNGRNVLESWTVKFDPSDFDDNRDKCDWRDKTLQKLQKVPKQLTTMSNLQILTFLWFLMRMFESQTSKKWPSSFFEFNLKTRSSQVYEGLGRLPRPTSSFRRYPNSSLPCLTCRSGHFCDF